MWQQLGAHAYICLARVICAELAARDPGKLRNSDHCTRMQVGPYVPNIIKFSVECVLNIPI